DADREELELDLLVPVVQENGTTRDEPAWLAYEDDVRERVFQRSCDLLDAMLWSPYAPVWTLDGGETVVVERREPFAGHDGAQDLYGEPVIYGEGVYAMPDELQDRYDRRRSWTALRSVFARLRRERPNAFAGRDPNAISKWRELARSVVM